MLKQTLQKKMDQIRKKASDFSLNKSGTIGVEPMGDSKGNRWSEVKMGPLGSIKVNKTKVEVPNKKSSIATPKFKGTTKVPGIGIKMAKKPKDWSKNKTSNGIGVGM